MDLEQQLEHVETRLRIVETKLETHLVKCQGRADMTGNTLEEIRSDVAQIKKITDDYNDQRAMFKGQRTLVALVALSISTLLSMLASIATMMATWSR